MTAEIKVVHMFTKVKGLPGVIVDTTSKADNDWQRDLSPFHLGPCELYNEFEARNMENAWQYAKVYARHAKGGEPTDAYWEWAKEGWANPKAVRYPMGRGAKPLYSLWNGDKLGYIDARKKIYAPLYAEAVQKTEGWQKLKRLHQTEKLLILRDWDGYNRGKDTLTEVLNNPRKKMGHAFVLAMLLTQDPALEQVELR
jgi:hypothetical protein